MNLFVIAGAECLGSRRSPASPPPYVNSVTEPLLACSEACLRALHRVDDTASSERPSIRLARSFHGMSPAKPHWLSAFLEAGFERGLAVIFAVRLPCPTKTALRCRGSATAGTGVPAFQLNE